MKYINLNQKWNIDRIKNPTADSDIKLTADWILTGIAGGYHNGFKNVDGRRMFATLKKKIEEVIDQKQHYISINPIEEVFIKSGFDQNISNPAEAVWIQIAEDAFLSATDKIPEAPKIEVGNAKLADQVDKPKKEETK